VMAAGSDEQRHGEVGQVVREVAGIEGVPFWSLWRGEAHHGWLSMVVHTVWKGASVKGVARWLWRPVQGSGRNGAALRNP
jgi:hypothetical protein